MLFILSCTVNEVIVYRVMMYANSLLIVQVMYNSLPKVNLYSTVLGDDFWKYLNGEFVFYVTIKIHYLLLYRMQDYIFTGRRTFTFFTEQYFIVNKRF